jgi:hypothetical protein
VLVVLLLFVTAPGPVPDTIQSAALFLTEQPAFPRRRHTASALEGRSAGTGRVPRSHRVYSRTTTPWWRCNRVPVHGM